MVKLETPFTFSIPATDVEIIGEAISNATFEKNQSAFERWGYKFEKVTENGEEVIKLTKKLKFTTKEIDDYVISATKNKKAEKVMLGKYDEGNPTSYKERAGNDHVYFDLGEKGWDDASALIHNNIEEMWRINKQFLDNQKALSREFYFSHDPDLATGFYKKEINYIKIDLKAKEIIKIEDNLWKAVW